MEFQLPLSVVTYQPDLVYRPQQRGIYFLANRAQTEIPRFARNDNAAI